MGTEEAAVRALEPCCIYAGIDIGVIDMDL